MDISLNTIDLMYLSKPSDMRKLYGGEKIEKDTGIYKNRIITITTNMLNGEVVNSVMNDAFERYVDICIRHLKFMDKANIIQADYLNVKKTKEICYDDYPIKDANKIIQKKKATITIKNFVNIKKKKTEIIPKIRKYLNINK